MKLFLSFCTLIVSQSRASFVLQQDDEICSIDNPATRQPFEECSAPVTRAFNDLLSSADIADDIPDDLLIPLGYDIAEMQLIKSLTSDTFFCEDDFLDNVFLPLKCDAAVCGYDCDILPEFLINEFENVVVQVSAELENCGREYPSYCELISSGDKSGYLVSLSAILLYWCLHSSP